MKKKGNDFMNDDIIVAIATSRLEAAISIIRLSGKGLYSFCSSSFLQEKSWIKQVIRLHMDL